MDVGIIGGTGPAGRGLAVRLSAAGLAVVIGSRDERRAAGVAEEIAAKWRGRLVGSLVGASNATASEARVVVLATPWESAVTTLRELRAQLDGKVVISMVNALVKLGKEFVPVVPPRGSMAATLAAAVPEVKLVAALHHLPAAAMEDLDSGIAADILVCSDSREALAETLSLIDRVEGLRPLDAGTLSQAMAIEAMTATIITVNIRNGGQATLLMGGI